MKDTFYFHAILLLLILTSFATCKNHKDNPVDQLPPATQTGANTFGCLVNGKVYIPKGYNGTGTPNPKKQFDIGLNGLPYFNITASQLNSDHISEGNVFISIGNIITTGIYTYPNDFNFLIGWKNLNNCGIVAFDSTTQKWGQGEITKYDLTNGIISSTFNFKYKTLTCDTVFVTDGRFDFKL